MAQTVILGEKVGMTQKWVDDKVVPVTVLRVEPMRIVQIKTTERDGYTALQVTYGHRDAKKLNQARRRPLRQGGRRSPACAWSNSASTTVDGFEVGQEITVEQLARGHACRRHRHQPWQGLRRHHEASQLQGPGRQPRQPQAPPCARAPSARARSPAACSRA